MNKISYAEALQLAETIIYITLGYSFWGSIENFSAFSTSSHGTIPYRLAILVSSYVFIILVHHYNASH